jgi:hypothetical protein
VSAIIPVGKMEVGKLKSDDVGVGDIQVRAGWNLPVEWASILTELMVKVPSGRFDHVKISLAAYQDVLTRNTNEGITVMSRIAFIL